MPPTRRPRLPSLLPLLVFVAVLLPAALRAEAVRLLTTEREAAEARVEMVLEAREEVLVSYFIVGHDPFALTALSLLRDAARRGVAVKLLVDDQWNGMPEAVQAHLLQEGIEIRTYHPFHFENLHWITRRMHDKLLVTDGETLLTGGRNIESPYFGLGPKQLGRRNYLDCDVQVHGEAAAEARAYFLALWNSREVRPARPRRPAAAVAEAARALDGHNAWLDAEIRKVRASGESALGEPIPVEGVRFLHDPVGLKGQAPGVGHELLALMDAARESVIVESPYLVPSRAFRRGLVRARERGVRVRILTNSLATTDNLFPQAGYVGHKGWLVENGVELWEYKGPECLHTKAAVIDGRRVIVGSFNLDPRSEKLNTEVALVLESPQVAQALLGTMDANLERAWRIDPRGIPEGEDERYPGVAKRKVWKLRMLRVLAPFIRKQL
jgi:cardiolipin synthase C